MEKNWEILLLQKVTGSSTNQSLPSPAQQDLKMLNLIDFVKSKFGSVHVANVFLWLSKGGNYGGKHQHFAMQDLFLLTIVSANQSNLVE